MLEFIISVTENKPTNELYDRFGCLFIRLLILIAFASNFSFFNRMPRSLYIFSNQMIENVATKMKKQQRQQASATRKRLHMCQSSSRRILSPIHTRSLTHSISVRSFTQLYNFSCFRRLFALLLLLLSFSSVMSLNITTHRIKSRHFERIKCSFGWRCPNESTQHEKPTNTRASVRSHTLLLHLLLITCSPSFMRFWFRWQLPHLNFWRCERNRK